jgi:GT2 family glycosyltransferase
MMVTRRLIENVGFMCEDYFLYYEEIDWAMRAKGRFKLGWAPDSTVLHKEGASIGSSHRSRPSAMSLQYLYRNRLRFSTQHVPQYRWSVWRSMVFDALVYLKRRDWEAARIILRNCFASHRHE